VELESAADELYAKSPEEFLERRTALVAQARADKDRPLATAIAKLRKPTRSAWLVNLLARQAPGDVAALLDIGEALRQAQAELSGPELRRLSQDRQRAVSQLTRRAAELGTEHSYEASEAVQQEIRQTLQAALADEAAAELVRSGRVTQALNYGGFGGIDLGAWTVGAPAGKARGDAAASTEAEAPAEEDQTESAARAERAKLDAARSAWQDAESAASEAEQQAAEATARADSMADELAELRKRVTELESAEQAAREDARKSRHDAGVRRIRANELAATLARLTHASG
jgi:hypothetical protein